MNTSAPPPSSARRAPPHGTRYRMWVVGLMVVVLSLTARVDAQDATASTRPAGESTPALPPGLAGIFGVKPGMTHDQLIALAREAMDAHRLEDAEKILFGVADQARRNTEALELLGQVYELRGDEAADAARRGDAKAGQQADRYFTGAINTYLYAAPIAAESGDWRAAERMYTAVLDRDASSARAQLGLVETAPLAMETKAMGAAERMYNKVRKIRPLHPQALLGKARLFVEAGRNMQAQDPYQKYLKTLEGREDARAFMELGRVYRLLKLPNLALTTLNKAIELNPEDPEILMELAQVYHENNASEQAIPLALKATTKAPENPAYHNIYAIILMKQSAPKIKQIQASLAAGGESTPARERDRKQLLTDLDVARREARLATSRALEQLAATPDDGEALDKLGRFYVTLQGVLQTIISIQTIPGKEEAPPADRVELAEVIRKYGAIVQTLNLHQALAALANAGDEAQKDVRFLESLAQLQFDVYKRDDAAETCRRLLEISPDNALAKELLARLDAAAGSGAAGPGG